MRNGQSGFQRGLDDVPTLVRLFDFQVINIQLDFQRVGPAWRLDINIGDPDRSDRLAYSKRPRVGCP
jgi:hypothetical protein